MGLYHIVLILLSAGSVVCCWRVLDVPMRCAAVSGVVAMALAMNGPAFAVLLGMALLVLAAPVFLCGGSGAMCWHRLASHLAMAAVIAALFLLNGGDICGGNSLPLLSVEGITQLPMSGPASQFVQLAGLAVFAYVSWGSALLVLALWRARAGVVIEIGLMTSATFGMAIAT